MADVATGESWPYGDWISPQVVQAAADQPRVILDAAQSRIYVLEQKVRLLEAKQENERLQHEQLYHDLEARWHGAMQSSAEKEDALRLLQHQVETQRVTMLGIAETETSLRDAAKQQAQRAAQLETQIEVLEARQREHLAILEQRHRELDAQRTESARLSESERTLRAEKQELDRRVVQLDAELIQTRYQLHKCSTEHNEIVKSRDWLEQQLTARSEQLSSAQAAVAALEADHRTTANTLQAELATREQQFIQLEHNHAFAVAERDRLRSELSALQQSSTQMQIQLEAKLEAQQRLIELHAAKSDDAQKALLEALAREEAAHQLAAQLKEQREASILKEAEKVSSLQEQLDAALQDVVLARSEGRPASDDNHPETPLQAEIDRLAIMDPSGRKHLEMLVTLQQKYELASESLRSERLEKNRLLALLQQIAEDLAAKEPQIERNRRDFERAKAEHAQLSASLEQSLAQNDQLRMQLEVLQRDSTILKQENDDLSRQVSVLLKECQQLESHSNPSDVAQNVDTIDGNFTFRNIKELQERYRELLRIVRELSSDEAETTKQTTKQLLETALTELRQVSQTRERQEEKLRHYSHLVESQKILIQEQESKYQQLLVQYQRINSGQSDVSPVTVTTPISQPRSTFDDSARLQELKATADGLREELKVCRETVLSLRLELATDKAKLDSESQRNSASSRALANMEDQVRDLRQRNAEFTRQVAELEKQNAQLLHDRTKARDHATALEFKLQAERVSLQLLEESSERYQKDIASLREERSSRDSLLSQMQVLLAERQSAIDSVRAHADASQREMNAQIVALRDDLQRVRELLQSERQELHLLRISSAQQIETASAKTTSLANELTQKEQEVQALKSALEEARRQLANTSNDTSHSQTASFVDVAVTTFEGPDAAVASNAATAILARKRGQELRLAQAQLKSKEEELKSLQDHLDSYRKISQESSEAFRQLQSSSASQLAEAARRIEQLNHQLSVSQETISKYEQELSSLRDVAREYESKIAITEASFSAKIVQLDEALRTSAAEYEIANTRQLAAEAERNSLISTVKDLQANYQRQVKELADALQKVSELQDSREELKLQLEQVRSELSVATARESTSATEHASLVTSLRKQITEERDRAEDALSQVTSLLRQVDTLTHGLTSSRLSGLSSDVNTSLDSSSAERINFLRREVEIHQLQISVLRQDLEHAKLQADHFRQQMDSYRQLLAEEQQKRVVTAQSQADYAERSHLLDQVNLLRESNITLRQETEAAAGRIVQLEHQLRSLELEKAPLAAQLLECTQQREAIRLELNDSQESLRMWQQRFQDMITRYQHIDPDQHALLKQEVESLKQQVLTGTSQLEAARKELESVQAESSGAQSENLKRQLDATRADLTKKTQKFNELLEKAKKLEQDKKAAEQARRDSEQQNSELQNRLTVLQQSFDSLSRQQSSPSDASNHLNTVEGNSPLIVEIENLKAQLTAVDDEKAALLKDVDDLTSAVGELEDVAKKLREEKEEIQSRIKSSEERVSELELKLKETQSTLEKKEVSLKRLYAFYKTHKDGSKASESAAQEAPAQEASTQEAPAQETSMQEQVSTLSDNREAELREKLLAQQQPAEPLELVTSLPNQVSAPAKSAKPPAKAASAPTGAAKKGKQLPVRGGPAAKKLAAKSAGASVVPSPNSPSADVMSPEAVAKRSRKFSQISASGDGEKTADTTSAPKRQKTHDTPEEPAQGN